jgi:hypothetical protein
MDVKEGKAGQQAQAAQGKPVGPSMQAPLELSRLRFWIIFLSLMLDIFLFALVRPSLHLPGPHLCSS